MDKKILLEFDNNNKKWKLFAQTAIYITVAYFLLLFFNFPLGDYNFFFFFVSLWTGAIWLKEKFYWKKQASYLTNFPKKKPYWIEWSSDIFPYVIVFFLIRGFIGEPFKIPSGSMEPTLYTGDIVLTNKFNYGIKSPLSSHTLVKRNDVKRGDVIVFKYPPSPNIYYIKRVIGLPGDKLEYYFQQKKLVINDKEIKRDVTTSNNIDTGLQYFIEHLEGKEHKIQLIKDEKPLAIPTGDGFLNKESCIFNLVKIECKIPNENYFAMGDNRDNSLDSRFWGFVPYGNITGSVNYAVNIFKFDFKSF
jgi:signal peptidase I